MKRFLITDDSLFMRSMMKNLLIECGHTVVGEARKREVSVMGQKSFIQDALSI